jgi:3-oxoacyl-[acyl-carrier-protein] synthase II
MRSGEVAVTGIGLVTPAGIGVAENWRTVVAAASAARRDEALAGGPVDISCRVPGFDAAELLGGRLARRLDRVTQFAVLALREALADAGLAAPGAAAGARVGVVLGCADGGPSTVEVQHRRMLELGAEGVSPMLLPMQLPNMLAGQISLECGATGPSLVVATACASGATALGVARDLLLAGRCDVVIGGGSEAMVTPLVMAGFSQMRALSRRTAEPARASRPFDAGRDGFVAGEGAGLLVLERPGDAAARGARIRGRIVGFGASADAYHVTAPDPAGRGAELAIRSALADSRRTGDDIDHVNAHGTGTVLNDAVEAAVLHRVLGERALVTSTKGVTGHLFGAAGAVETAFTLLALEEQSVPPTANLDEVDPGIAVPVAAKPTPLAMRTALTTSFGFGGQNAALVVSAA